MNGPQITVVGNVGAEPRLRSLAGGTAVADFRVAMTPSRFDKSANAWVDQETMWFSVSCWRAMAEHVSQSLKKGDRVIVTGRFSVRSWKTDQGEPRTSLEIDAGSVGMDLTRGPVTQHRIERPPSAGDAVPSAPDEPAEPAQDPWQRPAVDADPFTGEVVASVPAPAAAA